MENESFEDLVANNVLMTDSFGEFEVFGTSVKNEEEEEGFFSPMQPLNDDIIEEEIKSDEHEEKEREEKDEREQILERILAKKHHYLSWGDPKNASIERQKVKHIVAKSGKTEYKNYKGLLESEWQEQNPPRTLKEIIVIFLVIFFFTILYGYSNLALTTKMPLKYNNPENILNVSVATDSFKPNMLQDTANWFAENQKNDTDKFIYPDLDYESYCGRSPYCEDITYYVDVSFANTSSKPNGTDVLIFVGTSPTVFTIAGSNAPNNVFNSMDETLTIRVCGDYPKFIYLVACIVLPEYTGQFTIGKNTYNPSFQMCSAIGWNCTTYCGAFVNLNQSGCQISLTDNTESYHLDMIDVATSYVPLIYAIVAMIAVGTNILNFAPMISSVDVKDDAYPSNVNISKDLIEKHAVTFFSSLTANDRYDVIRSQICNLSSLKQHRTNFPGAPVLCTITIDKFDKPGQNGFSCNGVAVLVRMISEKLIQDESTVHNLAKFLQQCCKSDNTDILIEQVRRKFSSSTNERKFFEELLQLENSNGVVWRNFADSHSLVGCLGDLMKNVEFKYIKMNISNDKDFTCMLLRPDAEYIRPKEIIRLLKQCFNRSSIGENGNAITNENRSNSGPENFCSSDSDDNENWSNDSVSNTSNEKTCLLETKKINSRERSMVGSGKSCFHLLFTRKS